MDCHFLLQGTFPTQESNWGLPHCSQTLYHLKMDQGPKESESEVAQMCLTFWEPMDCSLTGSSVHGIFQARVLEWDAIAFSNIYTTMYKIDN